MPPHVAAIARENVERHAGARRRVWPRGTQSRTPVISCRATRLSIEGSGSAVIDDGPAGGQRRGGRTHGSSFDAPAPFRMEPVVTGSSAGRDVAPASLASVPPSRPGLANQVEAQNDRKPTAATVFTVHIKTERLRLSSSAPSIVASCSIEARIVDHGKGCVDYAVMRWGRPPNA